MAKWTSGRYNDHYLILDRGIRGCVNRGLTMEGKYWKASFLGHIFGEYDNLTEAKKDTEKYAEQVLLAALRKLQVN